LSVCGVRDRGGSGRLCLGQMMSPGASRVRCTRDPFSCKRAHRAADAAGARVKGWAKVTPRRVGAGRWLRHGESPVCSERQRREVLLRMTARETCPSMERDSLPRAADARGSG